MLGVVVARAAGGVGSRRSAGRACDVGHGIVRVRGHRAVGAKKARGEHRGIRAQYDAPARRRDGGYVLRETAQTPEEDLEALQDITRYRYVNTNNLWVGLRALAQVLKERNGVLGLPLIVNRKLRGLDPQRRLRNFDAFDLALNHAQ